MNNIKPKKSLGQNFLQDEKVLKKIIETAELSKEDNVLEIGSGRGALTRCLIQSGARVIAVEKDENLANELGVKLQITNDKSQINFKFQISNLPHRQTGFQTISNESNYNFQNNSGVISGDILEINLPLLLEENDFLPYKLVANIPYYITGKIVRLFFETKYRPKLIVLLVQKEVAQRICAEPGAMSILSVSVQCFGTPQFVAQVSRESFDPVPKVDSAILKIVPREHSFFASKNEEEKFFRFVKIGFASRRKTLANNLSTGLKIEKSKIEDFLQKQGFSRAVRAQELAVEDWLNLTKAL